MAYAQWVEVNVASENCTVCIQNANLKWGKFYQEGSKDNELSPDDINKLISSPGKNAFIGSCGREKVGSGTEGSFELYEGQTLIGTYSWECPWGSKDNKQKWIKGKNSQYITEVSGGNLDSGALGNVTISVYKKS